MSSNHSSCNVFYLEKFKEEFIARYTEKDFQLLLIYIDENPSAGELVIAGFEILRQLTWGTSSVIYALDLREGRHSVALVRCTLLGRKPPSMLDLTDRVTRIAQLGIRIYEIFGDLLMDGHELGWQQKVGQSWNGSASCNTT